MEKFITKSTQSGRAYYQIHKIDKYKSGQVQKGRVVHKVDEAKKWTSPQSGRIHKIDRFKPI